MELASGLLFSVVLVILAGLALRHALWLGRDNDAQRARDTINEFEHRTRSLHAALENEHTNQQKLRASVDQAAHDVASVKKSAEHRQAELTAQRAATAELERQLAERATEHADMQSTIEVLREQLRAVHNEVAEKDTQLREFIADSQGHLAQHAAHVEAKDQEMVEAAQRLEAVESDNATLQEQLARTEKQCVRFDEQIQSLEQELSSLEVENLQLRRDTCEFESIRDEMGRIKRGDHEMEETIKSLETQLQEALEKNQQLVSRTEAAMRSASQLDEQSQNAEQLRAVIEEFQEDLALQSEALAKLKSEKRADEQRLEAMQNELVFARDHGQEIAMELRALGRKHEAALNSVSELQAQVAANEEGERVLVERLRHVEIERDEFLRGLKREQAECARLDVELSAAREEIQQLQTETNHLAAFRGQCETAHGQLEIETERVDQLTRERDELQTSLSALATNHIELSQLRETAAQQETRLKAFTDEKNRLASSLESEIRVRQDVEEKLRVHVETIEHLRNDSKSLEALLAQQLALQTSLSEHTHRLTSSNDPGNGTTRQGDTDREILSFDEARRDHPATEDPQLGKLYSQRPKHVDDLKRISGVGHVLEEKLNALGIYTYEQIMNWSAETIIRFSELLSFKDRIERDQWVAQATRLHAETKFRAAG